MRLLVNLIAATLTLGVWLATPAWAQQMEIWLTPWG